MKDVTGPERISLKLADTPPAASRTLPAASRMRILNLMIGWLVMCGRFQVTVAVPLRGLIVPMWLIVPPVSLALVPPGNQLLRPRLCQSRKTPSLSSS